MGDRGVSDERLIRTLIEEEHTRQFFAREVHIAEANLASQQRHLDNAEEVVALIVTELRDKGYVVTQQWDHWSVKRDEVHSA